MVTTTPCDQGSHLACPGEGLLQGILRPPHEPRHPGAEVWVTVTCDCRCHSRQPVVARETLNTECLRCLHDAKEHAMTTISAPCSHPGCGCQGFRGGDPRE